MKACPIMVIRESPFDNTWVSHFSNSKAINSFKEVVQLQEEIEQLESTLITAIEQYIFSCSQENKMIYINLKRAIFNGRKIRLEPIENKTDSIEEVAIYKSAVKLKSKKAHLVQLEQELLHHIRTGSAEERMILWQEAKNNKWIRNALNFVAPNSVHSLNKYTASDVSEHRAKEKKFDYLLLKILTRASTKTSPFSSLTKTSFSSSMRDLGAASEELPHEKLITQINYKILLQVYEVLKSKDTLFTTLSFCLNDTIITDEEMLYVTSLVEHPKKEKVFETTDLFQKFKMNPFFNAVIALFEANSEDYLTYNEMKTALEKQGHQNIQRSLKFLMEKKFLLTKEQLSENEEMLHELIDKLYPFKMEPQIAKVIALLKNIEELLTDINQSFMESGEAVSEARKKIAELLDYLDLKTVSTKNYLFQDYLEDTIHEKQSIDENQKKNLEELLLLTRVFDGELQLQYLIGKKIKEKYGDQLISLEDGQSCIQDIVNLIIEYVGEVSSLNLTKSEGKMVTPELAAIASVKNQFIDFIDQHTGVEKLSISTQQLKEWTRPLSFLKKHDYSNSIFYQYSEDGKMIINNIYTGYLSYFSRFFYHSNKLMSDKGLNQYIQFLNQEKNIADIYNVYGFNANLRPRLTSRAVEIPNSPMKDKEKFDQVVTMDKLGLKYDSFTKTLKFYEVENEKPIKPIFLGSLIKTVIPSLAATIDTLANNGCMQISLAKKMINYFILKGGFEQKQLPEISVCDQIVLSRKKMIFDTQVFSNAIKLSDEEKVKWFLGFIKKNSLDSRQFVYAATIKTEQGEAYVSLEKPQFYEFSSVAFCRLFFRECLAGEYVVFEDCQPIISDKKVQEFLIELTN